MIMLFVWTLEYIFCFCFFRVMCKLELCVGGNSFSVYGVGFDAYNVEQCVRIWFAVPRTRG